MLKKIEEDEFPTDHKIEALIRNSPLELEEHYNCLVKEALSKGREWGLILAWTVYGREPLSLEALAYAIAINPQRRHKSFKECSKDIPNLTSRSIRKGLGTLLDIIQGHVCPIHQSVKDFFHQKDPLRGAFNVLSPRTMLANSCMTYLTFDELGKYNANTLIVCYIRHTRPTTERPRHLFFGNFTPTERPCVEGREETKVVVEVKKLLELDMYPLLEDAASYWHSHIERIEEVEDKLDLLKELLLPDQPKAQLWMCIYFHSIGKEPQMPHRLSEVALEFDIGWLAELLLTRATSELRDDFSEDYDFRAIEGQGKVLTVLLKYSAEFLLTRKRDSVLMIAWRCDERIMKLFLDKWAAETKITKNVAKAAAKNTYHGTKVMALLINT